MCCISVNVGIVRFVSKFGFFTGGELASGRSAYRLYQVTECPETCQCRVFGLTMVRHDDLGVHGDVCQFRKL